MSPFRRTKASPPNDRVKSDLINLMSSLSIVLEKIHDIQSRHSSEVGAGVPSPRTFMISQIEKSVRYSVAICKKAMAQEK